MRWYEKLNTDPLPVLQAASDPALAYWLQHDLLGHSAGSVDQLWTLPEAERLLKKQKPDGAWRYAGKKSPIFNYDLLETFRILRVLVVQYGLNRSHPQIERAAAYIFSCQTEEGDIRGIIGSQYMPYYHGVILELLVRAGYQDDARLRKGLDWLLSVRQDDGGWIVPVQLVPAKDKTDSLWAGAPFPLDRTQPHAHLATGMALRAFVQHPDYRHRDEVRLAGIRLKERFFKADKYNDRKTVAYWTKFQFPYWWTHLLMALESLEKIGFTAEDVDVRRGLMWFLNHQEADGLWPSGYRAGAKSAPARRWVGLAICTLLRRFSAGH